MKTSLYVVSILLLMLKSSVSFAAWDVTAHVTVIEPSYMPDVILFQLDMPSSTCPAGNWMWYYGTNYGQSDPKDNVRAIYTGLLTALSSGTKVEVHGETGCTANNVHPTSQ